MSWSRKLHQVTGGGQGLAWDCAACRQGVQDHWDKGCQCQAADKNCCQAWAGGSWHDEHGGVAVLSHWLASCQTGPVYSWHSQSSSVTPPWPCPTVRCLFCWPCPTTVPGRRKCWSGCWPVPGMDSLLASRRTAWPRWSTQGGSWWWGWPFLCHQQVHRAGHLSWGWGL